MDLRVAGKSCVEKGTLQFQEEEYKVCGVQKQQHVARRGQFIQGKSHEERRLKSRDVGTCHLAEMGLHSLPVSGLEFQVNMQTFNLLPKTIRKEAY